LTPVLGAAASASWPASVSCLTRFDPMRPVPPMTTIFMISPFVGGRMRPLQREDSAASTDVTATGGAWPGPGMRPRLPASELGRGGGGPGLADAVATVEREHRDHLSAGRADDAAGRAVHPRGPHLGPREPHPDADERARDSCPPVRLASRRVAGVVHEVRPGAERRGDAPDIRSFEGGERSSDLELTRQGTPRPRACAES